MYTTWFQTLHRGIFRETQSIEKGFGSLSLTKITIFLHQKTAQQLVTLYSHFIWSFCKHFFACKAPNFVENCISNSATCFETLHHRIFRETPSIEKGFRPLSFTKIAKFCIRRLLKCWLHCNHILFGPSVSNFCLQSTKLC